MLIQKIPVMKSEDNKEKNEQGQEMQNHNQKPNQNAEDSPNKKTSNGKEPLEEYLVEGLKSMLWIETAVAEGLKKMAEATSNPDLKSAFSDHEEETQKHIHRLKRVFDWLDQTPEEKKCLAMEGMITELDELLSKTPKESASRDAILVMTAQKIEHYEMACYGGLVQTALTLDLPKIADKLYRNLKEEEDADQLLNEIAETKLNFEVATS
jgi:ferritin-like metal-binding protein YciE